MELIKWTAYGCFAISGIVVVAAISEEEPLILSGALVMALVGVAFLAADRCLELLTDIRNRLGPVEGEDQKRVIDDASPGK